MSFWKKNLTYWIAKGWISFFMLFSAYFSYSHAEALRLLGFPDYFRIELTLAKLLGGILLLFPQTPSRVKEWIYAGFGIEMVSAIIAHICSHDPAWRILFVCADFIIIILCIRYVSKREGVLTTQPPSSKGLSHGTV
ncbi:DoxX family protein [Compostibacter hankyongensis]|uniref:DoxX family protein n=1 Tax=Compostibacter hankyongensis TaxID=1007089 RepID=A0ABP8G670_9BACT